MRLIAIVLILCIGGLSYDLWYGRNGVVQYRQTEVQLAQAQAQHDKLMRRNQKLEAELKDLRQGDISVEELARLELGLIKPDETFYRVIQPENN